MDEIKLPKQVLNRLELRWAARFAQMLEEDWPRSEQSPSSPACGCGDPLRSPQVRRLLEGSLRPPTLVEHLS